ncbi:MAG: GbsR/MarR family transcriptional regulator [Opitutales bacterium]
MASPSSTATAASKTQVELDDAKDAFIAQWGAMGSAWGINRTMAQIHALLMASPEPLDTDSVMEELRISRGNANTNLRELVGWGLVRRMTRRGERREFFEAEKDVWKMFCIIVRERKRREIEPALETLRDCLQRTQGLRSREAQSFHQVMADLEEFVALADNTMEKISRSDRSKVIPWVLKTMG